MNRMQQINVLAVYYRDCLLATEGWNHPSAIELLLRLAIRNGMDLIVNEQMPDDAKQKIAQLEAQITQLLKNADKAKLPSKERLEADEKLKKALDEFRRLKERYEISLVNHENEVNDLRQYLADVQDQLATTRTQLADALEQLDAIPIDNEREKISRKTLDMALGREKMLKLELKEARKREKEIRKLETENEALRAIIETERSGRPAQKTDL